MKIPFFNTDYIDSSLRALYHEALDQVIEGDLYAQGIAIHEFETDFSKYLSAENFVSCANGTDALEIIIEVLGLEHGDEIILPSFSCQASIEPFLKKGMLVKFVDIKDDFTIDVRQLKNVITKHTRAVLCVHLFGNACEMDVLVDLARENNLYLIEDCAQAHGLRIGNKMAGTFGHASAFSFYPTKNLGALGEAGGMVFQKEIWAQKARELANHGQSEKNVHNQLGRNSRMDTLQAAFLRLKLPFLDQWNDQRLEIANRYFEELPIPKPKYTVAHQMVIQSSNRQKLTESLTKYGIGHSIHYPYTLPDISSLTVKSHTEEFIFAVKAALQNVSLPCYPGLTDIQLDYIIDVLKKEL